MNARTEITQFILWIWEYLGSELEDDTVALIWNDIQLGKEFLKSKI